MTASLPQKTGDEADQPSCGLETIQENMGHLERRLARTREQALALQQPPLEVEPAARALAAWEQGFGVLPVIEQARLMQLMIQRIEYDGAQGKLAVTLDPAGLVVALEEQTKHDEETAK